MEVLELPPNEVPFACKWIYKVKYKIDGFNKEFKAKLVAKEYNQQAGFDYH